MKIEDCAICIQLVDQIMSQPVGEAITVYVKQFSFPIPFFDHYFEARKKLNHNKYDSPQDFLVDFKAATNEILQHVDDNSDICYCIQYIQDKIEEKFKIFEPGNNDEWIKSTKGLITNLNYIIPQIPDNSKAADAYYKSNSENPGFKAPNPDPNFDINQYKTDIYDTGSMRVQISCLKNDEDVLDVTQIIASHEPEFVSDDNGDIVFDLSKCSGYTLSLIQALLNRAPMNPPPKEPIQHANSTNDVTEYM